MSYTKILSGVLFMSSPVNSPRSSGEYKVEAANLGEIASANKTVQTNEIDASVEQAADKVLNKSASERKSIPTRPLSDNADSVKERNQNKATQSNLSKFLQFFTHIGKRSKKQKTEQDSFETEMTEMKWQTNAAFHDENKVSSEAIKKMATPEAQETKKKSSGIKSFIQGIIKFVKSHNPLARITRTKKAVVEETKEVEKSLPSNIEPYHNLVKQMINRLEQGEKKGSIPLGLFRVSGSKTTVEKAVTDFKETEGHQDLPSDWHDATSMIKNTVMSQKAPPMQKIKDLNIPAVHAEAVDQKKSEEEIIQNIQGAIFKLDSEERNFLKDYLKMIDLTYQKSWPKEQAPGDKDPFTAYLQGTPSLTNVFSHESLADALFASMGTQKTVNLGYVEFLVNNREKIFQTEKTEI